YAEQQGRPVVATVSDADMVALCRDILKHDHQSLSLQLTAPGGLSMDNPAHRQLRTRLSLEEQYSYFGGSFIANVWLSAHVPDSIVLRFKPSGSPQLAGTGKNT